MSLENIVQVLGIVQLDCIQEVEVSCIWHLSTLAMFAPFLGQMSNIQRLHLSHINLPALEEQEERHHIVQITLQFLKLYHLRHLHLEFLLLKGCLDQRGHQRADRLKPNHRKLANLIIWTTALSNSMKLSCAV